MHTFWVGKVESDVRDIIFVKRLKFVEILYAISAHYIVLYWVITCIQNETGLVRIIVIVHT